MSTAVLGSGVATIGRVTRPAPNRRDRPVVAVEVVDSIEGLGEAVVSAGTIAPHRSQ